MSDWLLYLSDVLALISLVVGLAFMLMGAVGIVRLPDFYHRMHAASKCSTLGLLGLLLAVGLHLGSAAVLAKAALAILLAFVATPVGAHMLTKAALRARVKQWHGTLSDEHAQDAGSPPPPAPRPEPDEPPLDSQELHTVQGDVATWPSKH